MNSKEIFMETVEKLFEASKESVPNEAYEYFNKLKDIKEENKPPFTKNGAIILQFLQSAPKEIYKAKEIADELGISSRSVSGSCRKLATDEFISKIGKDPIAYSLTEKGRNVEIVMPADNE